MTIYVEKIVASITTSGSPAATTGSAVSSTHLNGNLEGIYLGYRGGGGATTCIWLSYAGSPATKFFQVTSGNTDGWYYPKILACNASGAALTTTGDLYGKIPLSDYVNVAISGAGSGTSYDIYLLYEKTS